MKIGFFDSGFGGLSIMREVVKVLGQYDYVYLGDSLHVPYGPRPAGEVHDFTLAAVDFLFKQDCQLVVIACNTATAQALRQIQRQYLPSHAPDRRVLGVLLPAVEEAVGQTRNLHVGVMATQGSVNSGAFVSELAKANKNIHVFQQACPDLVTLIEAGKHGSPELIEALKRYLEPLLSNDIDTLILGSTHYSLVADDIQRVVGPKVKLIDEGPVVAQKLANYLNRHPELDTKLSKNGSRIFYSTKPSRHFNNLGSQFFGSPIKAELAALAESE